MIHFIMTFVQPLSSNDYTDIILSDRRRNYYNENIILCENGCEYLSYNSDNNLVRCKCFVKSNIEDEIKKISFQKENLSYFFNIKTYANFDIIKCYSLLFSKKGLTKNYGAYLLQLIIFLYIIIMIIFYINYKNNIIILIVKAYPKYKYKNSSSSSPLKKNSSQIILKVKDNSILSQKKKSKKITKKKQELMKVKFQIKMNIQLINLCLNIIIKIANLII